MVILDFWTFCCVNCLHVVPTLSRIEQTFSDEVVVIGVHSPKFPAERDGRNLRAAIARCGVTHPVIQDPDMTLWSEYCVKAWPTLVFIAPDGTVLGTLAGEPDPERLIGGVGAMLHDWRGQGMLKTDPLPLKPLEETGGGLRFPGKIKPLVNGTGRRNAGRSPTAVIIRSSSSTIWAGNCGGSEAGNRASSIPTPRRRPSIHHRG